MSRPLDLNGDDVDMTDTEDNVQSSKRPRDSTPTEGEITQAEGKTRRVTVDTPQRPALMEEATPLLASGGTLAAKETPVVWHSPTYGFPETHTTIIPTTFYLSANLLGVEKSDKNKVELRLNSPYTPLITTPVTQPTASPRIVGISVDPAPDATTNGASLFAFPTTYTTNHKCQWLKYWEKIYQSYTVLETQYEITVRSAVTNTQCGVSILWEEDQYGNSSTGNTMPDASLDDMANWRGVKRRVISSLEKYDPSPNGPSYTTIKGVWKPGMKQTNVKNDGDNKTWSAVGAVPSPTYVESLHLRFFEHMFNTSAAITGANMQIKLKYIVQFKDLNTTFRYPLSVPVIEKTTLTVPDDLLKTA